MKPQVTSCNGVTSSSHQLTPCTEAHTFRLASNQPLDECNRLSFFTHRMLL